MKWAKDYLHSTLTCSSRVRKAWLQILAIPTNHRLTSPLGANKGIAVHTSTYSSLKTRGPLSPSLHFLPDHKDRFLAGRTFLPAPVCPLYAYQGLSLAPPQALLGPAWLCDSSWPAAQQTSVPWGFRTGTFPLPRERMAYEYETVQAGSLDPFHWTGTQLQRRGHSLLSPPFSWHPS